MRGRKPFILGEEERPALRKKVLGALKPGKKSAITGKELAQLCNRADDRLIRVTIEELLQEGVPVASSVTEPYGFYIASNAQEAAEYIRVLKGRKREIELRLEHFERACGSLGELPRQPSLV